MKCPKCGSENVQIQTINEVSLKNQHQVASKNPSQKEQENQTGKKILHRANYL